MAFGLILFTSSCQKEVRVEKSNFTMKNRVLMLDGNKFTGVAFENYSNGQLKSEWTMLNGIEHGQSTEVKAQHAFNEKDGFFETYYKNGSPWRKGYYDNGKLEGAIEEYYDNGKLKTSITWSHDKKEGPVEEYYENGQLKSSGYYKNDLKDGVFETFSESGELIDKFDYEMGKPVG